MARPKGDRTERFNMMLTPGERADLDKLAARAGVDASTYIRGLIEKEAIVGHVHFATAASGYKTTAARNKGIRGRYLREIVAFAEALDEAVGLWRDGKHDEALRLAEKANFTPSAVGTYRSWRTFFESHAGNEPGIRAKPTLQTTNAMVLSLIDWKKTDASGATLPQAQWTYAKLSDGRAMIRYSSVATALGNRKGRRRRETR